MDRSRLSAAEPGPAGARIPALALALSLVATAPVAGQTGPAGASGSDPTGRSAPLSPVEAGLAAPEPSPPSTTGQTGVGGAVPPAPPEALADPRPAVQIRVVNAFRRDDEIFPKVVEGRLITDLEDMETFRAVGSNRPGDYILTCTIRNLTVESGGYYDDRQDAETDGRPQYRDALSATMHLEILVEDGSGSRIYEGKLTVGANQDLLPSSEQTVAAATREMVDRAAIKIERLLRKKLPR